MYKINEIEIVLPDKILNDKGKLINTLTKAGNVKSLNKTKIIKISADSNIKEPVIKYTSTSERLDKLKDDLHYKTKPKILDKMKALIDSAFKPKPEIKFEKKVLKVDNIEVIDKIKNHDIIIGNVKPNKKSKIIINDVKPTKAKKVKKEKVKTELIFGIEIPIKKSK